MLFREDKVARADADAIRKSVGFYRWTHDLVEITGKDALAVLQKIYISDISKVAVGRSKYTASLDENGEIIDDVSSGRSELGLLYLCESNESVLSKLLRKNELVFEELFTAEPHVFISRDHPLAVRARITLDELRPYPYLVFEQGATRSIFPRSC